MMYVAAAQVKQVNVTERMRARMTEGASRESVVDGRVDEER